MNVQLNWIQGRPELENENLLSAFGISLAIDRSKSRRIPSFPFLRYVYLFLTLDFSGIAKENLREKSPELMKKFSVMRFAQGAIQRPAEKPLPLSPKV